MPTLPYFLGCVVLTLTFSDTTNDVIWWEVPTHPEYVETCIRWGDNEVCQHDPPVAIGDYLGPVEVVSIDTQGRPSPEPRIFQWEDIPEAYMEVDCR